MGRIADSALALLAGGPLDADRLGARLAESGATRSRDPGAAVRRAFRDDPRVVQLADGRFAGVAQALTGVALATVVDAAEEEAGALELEPDLAVLGVLGLVAGPALPAGARAGDTVVVRVDDAELRRVSAELAAPPPARPADEAALVGALRERLGRSDPDRPGSAPPITHLGTVVAGVAAGAPGALREPGRPLGEVLAGAGIETHLGWAGPPGTAWDSLTEAEVDALEADVADLLAAERTADAARVQGRLLAVLRRHVPERVPAARRRLARILARAGRPAPALEQLVAAFPEGDPEDLYEAAVIACRQGDERSARRWVETGLAHAEGAGRAEVAECLEDIGDDLDAQAAFLRARDLLNDGAALRDDDGPEVIARAVTGLRRSYLVEAMVEEILSALPPQDVGALLGALADAGEVGRDACRAFAAILPPGRDRGTAEALGQGPPSRIPAVSGLLTACPSGAWATSPLDAPDQQQVVVTIAKEAGRLSPLVVLIDLDELGGAVKDAFFLPDMIEPRLRRELFAPMDDMGLPSAPVDLAEAIALVQVALARTEAVGWRIPSLQHQPVVERIERWLLRPQRGDPGRRRVAGT